MRRPRTLSVSKRSVAKFALELRPLDQIVPSLERAGRRQSVRLGRPHRLVEAFRRILGKPDGSHLSGFHQRIHHAEAFRQRHVRIVLVVIIEIDRLDPQPLQRSIASRGDLFRREFTDAVARILTLHEIPVITTAMDVAAEEVRENCAA